ncbi:DUF3306 domain-containing protein [Caenimonas sedimenti]|uniref:DUF3306 domain-containing protein n=1 Tax=Caenimonas sedimenti TaxID=2596921 RepID=A0A562ZUB0_9BURK|nr:DUF3306 domain-containing protein [Caenimonas sedimenti]TWO72190.1 DUF3306 domain-containing protein [Caenimonas sedimenti]
MGDGFLGRWAKRKEAVRQGKAVEAEPVVPVEVAVPLEPPPQPSGGGSEVQSAPEAPPPPTLQDTESLTPTSDFTRFVARDVPPDVKNAALKKLFADPHFNVMDRLDTYIDDYSKPDPLPASWLRQLASAKFLNFFEEEKKEAEASGGREVADDPTPQSVAQSGTAAARDPQAVPPPADDHADPDLRLQQDHAPGPPGPGQGTR